MALTRLVGKAKVRSPVVLPMFRPLLEAAIDAALGMADQPHPNDIPRVYASGPDADRLLLIGTAAVSGVGVASHEVGLAGRLARRISAITGRGVDLTIEGTDTLTVIEATESLRDRSLASYDAVVLVVGSREAIAFQPMRRWKPQLRSLLATIAESDAAPHIFVVATPPLDLFGSIPPVVSDRLRTQIIRQNQVSESVCAPLPGVDFLLLGSTHAETATQLGSAAYENLAGTIAPAIARWLDRNPDRRRVPEPLDEEARQAALDALNIVGSGPDPRFDRVAQTARDLLGASGASVTFLDHDRQWIKSAVSMNSRDTARASSFCNTTITSPEMFVVEDAAADDAFAGHPWVVGEDHVRFYAGYPVEAPNGQRVGALCVVDTKPRHLTTGEAALLRELALRVQTVLWAD